MRISERLKTRVAATKTGDAIIWTAAVIHTLAALSLLIILAFITPASAAEDLSCGGHDVLAELQDGNPEAYAAIKKSAEEIPNSDSIFWKIEKDGIPASYLLGTMHMSDPRVLDLPKGAQNAFGTADTLIIESDEILDPKVASAKLLAHPELTMFTDGKTINNYLTADEKALLEKELGNRGVPFLAISKMKPWMLSSFVALPACETARKQSGVPFLDQKLAMDAKAAGKKIVGLETMVEQLNAMASLSMDLHIKGLISTLKDPQRSKDLMETLIVLYDQGRPGWVEPLSNYLYPEDAEGFSMTEFDQKMVLDRNHRMADRALPVLSQGNVFMAVGALHLSGKEGLVELLRQVGFKLTPLQ